MRKSQMIRTSALLASACLVALAGSAAQAQTAEPAAKTAAEDDGGVADIVVTATRRTERLQDVPVSVTAVTSEAIVRQNVRDIGDLPKLVPGLTLGYGTQPGNFSINLRGVGTLANGIAVESDVAVVIDDVPAGFQAAAFKDLVDVERVEALKGPQSTLFGKSAISGVLNITTQAPTDTWTGKVTGLVTDDHEWRLGGTISGPISENLKFRVTASRDSWDGNIDNLADGSKMNGTKGFTLTGKLQWDPTDSFSVSLLGRYNFTDTNCCVTPLRQLTPGLFYQGITQLPATTALAGIDVNDKWNTAVRRDYRAGGKARSRGVTLRANYTMDGGLLDGASLTYIGSYDHYHLRDYEDVDTTASPFLLYYPVAAPSGINSGSRLDGYFDVKSTTQELRLTSPSGPFRYLFGLWYAHNDLERDLDRGPVLARVHYLANSSNTNASFYGDLAWELAPKLTAVGGFRINNQKLDYRFQNFTAATPFTLSGNTSDTAFTGKIGAQYHITPDNMLYATYSTGYKGQAYDLSSVFNATIAAQSPVAAETAKNYEIGIKNSFFDRKLVLNATAFQTDYYGFQASSITVLANGFPQAFLRSVGHLRTRGVEAEFTARPTSNLSLNGSAAYMQAKIVDFPTGPCYPRQASSPLATNTSVPVPGACGVLPSGSTVQNISGGRLPNAPEWKFNLGGQYDIPLSDTVGAFVTMNYRYQSKLNYSLNQDPLTVQPGFGIVDASIGFSANEGQYKLTAFVNNLFDKHYAANIFDNAQGFSAPGVTAIGVTWQPARDAFRYAGVRFDAKF